MLLQLLLSFSRPFSDPGTFHYFVSHAAGRQISLHLCSSYKVPLDQ
jgi:hypothetical protein